MTEPDVKVSVAVVPRERFSSTAATLRSIAANTPDDVEIVWVDNGHPAAWRERPRRPHPRGRRVPTERWLRPGATHNAAIDAATGDFIVIVENNVLVEPGWLEKLMECAEKTECGRREPDRAEFHSRQDVGALLRWHDGCLRGGRTYGRR